MRFWLSLAVVLLADRITKWLIISSFHIGESRTVIEGVLNLTYIQNQGAAFGLMQGMSWMFLICGIIVITGLIFFNMRYPVSLGEQIITGLIAGGALGNLIDRYLYNYVVDFLDLGWWPVFNIADCAIVVGGILLVWYMIKIGQSEEKHG